jgi:hypothetical protein
MAALTSARSTRKYSWDSIPYSVNVKMKGSTTIYQGGLVVLDGGYAEPGNTAAGLIAFGRAEETKTNAGADGAESILVSFGVFKWANSAGGDAVADADVGGLCYVVDDQTVMKTAAGKSAAGRVIGVEADGVWVITFPGFN